MPLTSGRVQTSGPQVSFLVGAQRQFLVELAVHLRAIIFAPEDVIHHGNLYIIHDGAVLIRGRVLQKGAWWGEDVRCHRAHHRTGATVLAPNTTLPSCHCMLRLLRVPLRDAEACARGMAPLLTSCPSTCPSSQMVLQSIHLRLRHAVRAIAYTTCFFVDRDTLMTLAERYPATMKLIRRFAAMTALRRELILRTRVAAAAKELGGGTNSGVEHGGIGFDEIWGGGASGPGASTRSVATPTDTMLWNATHGVLQAAVDPLIGHDAHKVKQAAQISAIAKASAEQAQQMRAVHEHMAALEQRQSQQMEGLQRQLADLEAAIASTQRHHAATESSPTGAVSSAAISVANAVSVTTAVNATAATRVNATVGPCSRPGPTETPACSATRSCCTGRAVSNADRAVRSSGTKPKAETFHL